MFKSLSGLFSGVPVLPYNLEEPFETAWGEWTHYSAHSKDGDELVSVFKANPPSTDDPRWQCVKNGAKRLKMLRHPNILVYKDMLEIEQGEKSGGGPVMYLVTEPVVPLSQKLAELNLTGSDREQYYSVGMHQITKAVSFLNNDCRLIHGNVCLEAVLVSATLDWKLHGFDLLTEYDTVHQQDAPLQLGCGAVAEQYMPEEVRQVNFEAVKAGPPWAVDSWGLGCFWQELFRGGTLSRMDMLREVSLLPPLVVKDYQHLLASNPARRLNPLKCLENNEYFQNKLVDTLVFLEQIALKDSNEKDSFFKRLGSVITNMCGPIAIHKMLPLLGSALEFGSAPAVALGPYLQIARTLPDDEFVVKVVPTLAKLFASSDRALRVALLTNMESFAEHISAPVMEKQVWPHVEKGYGDSTAYLRELTLKSTLFMVPKLSANILNQHLLKYLSKLQVDEEQAIRANTTICLGNIARYLSEATCKRVLLNAFTRALRDSFPPTRAAALVTLVATAQYYDATEAAQRIIPAVGPLCIDADLEVRTNAFKCVECFVTFLKRYSDRVEKGEGAVSAPLTEGNSSAGLLSWAVTSLASRMGGKPKEEQSKTSEDGGTKDKPAAVEDHIDRKESTASINSTFSIDSANPISPKPDSLSPSKNSPSQGSPAKGRFEAGDMDDMDNMDNDDDGWGDDLELDTQLADELAARARLTTTSASSSRPRKPAVSSPQKNNSGAGLRDSGTSDPSSESSPTSGVSSARTASTRPPNPKATSETKRVVRTAASKTGPGPARRISETDTKPVKKVSKLGAVKKSSSSEDFDWSSFLDE